MSVGQRNKARQAGFLGEKPQFYRYYAFPREQAHPLKSWACVNSCVIQGKYFAFWSMACGHSVSFIHGYQQPNLGA